MSRKKISLFLSLLFAMFFIVHWSIFAQGNNLSANYGDYFRNTALNSKNNPSSRTTTTTTTTSEMNDDGDDSVDENHKGDKGEHKYTCGRYNHHTSWAKKKRSNFWIWFGSGLLFGSSGIEPYIDNPTMNYQLGISKAFYNVSREGFFYATLMMDYSFSELNLAPMGGITYSASYFYHNIQATFGFEYELGTRYLSGFLEAGPAFQMRAFLIRHPGTNVSEDYDNLATVGGAFNGGINIKIVPENRVTYFFRLAMDVMIGAPSERVLNYNGATANANALTYTPSIAFAVKM